MENLTGGRVKTIHTDNGGEYTSNKFQEYLLAEGIHHQQRVYT